MTKTMLSKFYALTVKPVTVCSMIFTVYSAGYYYGSVDVDNYKNKVTEHIANRGLFEDTLCMTHSLIIGYCAGITYPISIPFFIGYEIFTANKN